MCDVGALYLTLTGDSGFRAAVLDELKSRLKLRGRRDETERLIEVQTRDGGGPGHIHVHVGAQKDRA